MDGISREIKEIEMTEENEEIRETREIEAQGERVVELFTVCAAAPDDLEAAERADAALAQLDNLLNASA